MKTKLSSLITLRFNVDLFDSPSEGCHLVGRVCRENRPLDVERNLDGHLDVSPILFSFYGVLHICKDFSMTLDEMFVNVFDHLVVLQSRRFTSYHCQVTYFIFQGLLFAKKLHIPTGLERDILKQVVPGLNVNVHNDLLVVGLP